MSYTWLVRLATSTAKRVIVEGMSDSCLFLYLVDSNEIILSVLFCYSDRGDGTAGILTQEPFERALVRAVVAKGVCAGRQARRRNHGGRGQCGERHGSLLILLCAHSLRPPPHLLATPSVWIQHKCLAMAAVRKILRGWQ